MVALSKKLFIINPISGGRDKSYIPEIIGKELDDKTFEIVFTKGRGHASELTAEGIKNGFTDFIAVGGDGTVNEVAKMLINTNFNFGILPLGSGNGLARHNGIPLSTGKAIRLLNNPGIRRIDTCKLNNLPFINVSGVGFDAHIGKLFAESKGRGFATYFRQTIHEFKNYRSKRYTISSNGNVISENAFLISFANSSQYGNNAFIAPHADMTDGMIDVSIMKPFPPFNIIELGFKLFTKQIDKSQYVDTIRTKTLTVEREGPGEIHIDGEPVESGKTLVIEVMPKSLNLIVPLNPISQ